MHFRSMERWTALWALGAALLVAGAVLLFVPVVPDGPHHVSVPAPPESTPGSYFLVENISTYSITGSVLVSVSWSSDTPLELNYAICSTHKYNLTRLEEGYTDVTGCQPLFFTIGNLATKGGSLSVSVSSGGAIVVAFNDWFADTPNANLTYTVWTGLTLASPVLFGAGIVSVGLGVVNFQKALKSRPSDQERPERIPPA